MTYVFPIVFLFRIQWIIIHSHSAVPTLFWFPIDAVLVQDLHAGLGKQRVSETGIALPAKLTRSITFRQIEKNVLLQNVQLHRTILILTSFLVVEASPES